MHCNSRCFMMNRIPEYKYNHLGTSESSDENNLLKKEADDFYMEYLSVCKTKLHTSKLPHRKTLNDFVVVCDGEMEKTICSDNYLLQQILKLHSKYIPYWSL